MHQFYHSGPDLVVVLEQHRRMEQKMRDSVHIRDPIKQRERFLLCSADRQRHIPSQRRQRKYIQRTVMINNDTDRREWMIRARENPFVPLSRPSPARSHQR